MYHPSSFTSLDILFCSTSLPSTLMPWLDPPHLSHGRTKLLQLVGNPAQFPSPSLPFCLFAIVFHLQDAPLQPLTTLALCLLRLPLVGAGPGLGSLVSSVELVLRGLDAATTASDTGLLAREAEALKVPPSQSSAFD